MYELERLERHSPVEFGLTLSALSRFLPKTTKVAVEVGVGSGAYSLWLASRGIDVYLIDVSEKLLEAAVNRLCREGLGGRIGGSDHVSATELRTIPDSHADVVLALGPFYHLRQLDLWGLESFTSPAQQKLLGLSEEDLEAWFDIVARTAPLSEALGVSDHFLYVGKRKEA